MPLIYYLPGWNGELGKGLGSALMHRDFEITGRETRDEFKNFSFTEQVETVSEDLKENFWSADSLVVAVSFGAYLFLHAQATLPSYPGKVLLLSPIVGGFSDEKTGRVFSPPQESRLFNLAQAGQFPRLDRCDVHTGSEDWQSHPDAVTKFFNLIGVQAVIAGGRGHSLGVDYVGKVLDDWLPSVSSV